MKHLGDITKINGAEIEAVDVITGGNQVPLTYQQTTGTLSPGAHAGSYNGQDAYNDTETVRS